MKQTIDQEENKKKLCRIFQCDEDMEMEQLADRLIKMVYPEIDVNLPKTYFSTHLLVTAILYYFVEFVDPENYTFAEIEDLARDSKFYYDLWDVTNMKLENAAKDPTSKCGVYYQEYHTKYLSLAAFEISRDVFYAYVSCFVF